jgi:MSHA pilin protein MshA
MRAKAITQGLAVSSNNPGNQSALIVDFDGESSEIDWRNLCPESVAELGDRLNMLDFIHINTSGGLSSQLNNQYTLVGFDIPGFSVPTNQGCYVIYNSFGSPSCTVTVVTADC